MLIFQQSALQKHFTHTICSHPKEILNWLSTYHVSMKTRYSLSVDIIQSIFLLRRPTLHRKAVYFITNEMTQQKLPVKWQLLEMTSRYCTCVRGNSCAPSQTRTTCAETPSTACLMTSFSDQRSTLTPTPLFCSVFYFSTQCVCTRPLADWREAKGGGAQLAVGRGAHPQVSRLQQPSLPKKFDWLLIDKSSSAACRTQHMVRRSLS